MNAIELADELINWYSNVNLCVYSAIMLRQQAKEIEELKQYKEKIELMEQSYDAHIKKSMCEVKDLIKKASKK